MPGRLLLLLFVALPVVDLYLLIRIGRWLGAGPVVLLVLGTALLGVTLAKAEGFRVLRRWQRELSQGRVPEEGVLSGVLLLLGAVLLILPGVITDTLGLALLFRPTRRLVAALMKRSVAKQIRRGTIRVVTSRVHVGPPPGYGPFDSRAPVGPGGGRVIEAEGGTVDETRMDRNHHANGNGDRFDVDRRNGDGRNGDRFLGDGAERDTEDFRGGGRDDDDPRGGGGGTLH